MSDILHLLLPLVLALWVGFQLGHLVTSYQYEVCHGYKKSRECDDKVDKIEGVE